MDAKTQKLEISKLKVKYQSCLRQECGSYSKVRDEFRWSGVKALPLSATNCAIEFHADLETVTCPARCDACYALKRSQGAEKCKVDYKDVQGSE